MRIASNTVQDNIVRQIQTLGGQTSKLQTQVATGQRIDSADDDPAAAGRVLSQQSELRRVAQYSLNATRAIEISQASFAGLNSLKDVSDRATEIATLGRSPLGAEALNAYATEVNQMVEQLMQVGNSRLGNDYIFAGTAVDTAPFTATRDANGDVTAAAYVGNTSQANIPLSEVASVTPFTNPVTNQGIGDMINRLVALRDALKTADGAAIGASQSDLQTSEDLLVSALADNGAVQLRIEVQQTQQQSRGDNLVSLVSSETAADLPNSIVRLNQAQTAYQAALQSAANIMRISLLDYIK
jgi:flagellar hook-associated protein 3 FlgL